MANSHDWRSELSFAHRLQTTTRLKAAILLARPEVDGSNALAQARQLENTVYNNSSSAEEYDERCREASEHDEQSTSAVLAQQDANHPQGKDDDFQLSGSEGKPRVILGEYTDCVHVYSGLFSTVYATRSKTMANELLAIKITSPSSEAPPHNSRREVRILSSLSHQNIIALLDSQRVPNQSNLLLVFPFMPLTLATLLETKEKVNEGVLADLASALAYIHSLCIIHRDIKPANVLLSSASGPALICDFGIAWSPTDPSSEPRDAKIIDIGTTCYRAPELLFGQRNYSSAVDMWAVGCVFAEVLMHNSTPESSYGWTLFDAGELGSELALVKSIFETLGTPNARTWPETQSLPDWGKMTFVDFPARPWPEVLPFVPADRRPLVSELVQYESSRRMKASELAKTLAHVN